MENFDAMYRGTLGGSSTSPAKQAAARRNGKLASRSLDNGRPRTRTLGEVIMRCKLAPAGYAALDEAFIQLTQTEKDDFRQRYGLKRGDPNVSDLRTTTYRAAGKPSPAMQHVLRKMRLVARYRLGKK